MDIKEQEYYDRYFDLFRSEGWKQFLSELVASLDDHKEQALAAKDLREMGVLQGQLLKSKQILAMESLIRQAYDMAKEDEQDGV